MSDFDLTDYFTDPALLSDPLPYFNAMRARGPVVREPHHGVVVITGYDEAFAVYRDDQRFSSANAPSGPFPGLPFKPEGDDIGPQIEQHRSQMAYGDWLVTRDRPAHTAYRSLLMGLITPLRLKKNEEFLLHLAERQIDTFIDRGDFEVITDFARPFTILALADLLGVPEDDHKAFCNNFAPPPGQVSGAQEVVHNPLDFLTTIFTGYIEDRRRDPRKDGLTELALAKFPDGTTPTVTDVVNTATFLFGAGQDTSARLITSALRLLGERAELQQQLRNERHRIPDFLEEVLRLEPPVKCGFRVARVHTKVGDLDVTPGTTIMLLIGAITRDPKRFEQPDEFRLDRKNARDHLAFGRGIHACAGSPLARAEGRISLERIFDRTADTRISTAKHGPAGARRYEYEPTYLLRGLRELHVEITPNTGERSSRAA